MIPNVHVCWEDGGSVAGSNVTSAQMFSPKALIRRRSSGHLSRRKVRDVSLPSSHSSQLRPELVPQCWAGPGPSWEPGPAATSCCASKRGLALLVCLVPLQKLGRSFKYINTF